MNSFETLKSFCLVLLCGVLLFPACRKEKDVAHYDVEAVLRPIAEGVIVPRHAELVRKSDVFRAVCLRFENETTLQVLGEVRRAFLELYAAWANCEAFEFGEIKGLFLHNRMSKWPTNPDQVNQAIEGQDSVTASFIESRGSTAKGLAAMEYLLFALPLDSTLLQYTQASHAVRRTAYLQGLAINFQAKARELSEFWGGGDGYGERWVNSLGTGAQHPMSLFANSLIAMVQNIAQEKVGKPLGKFDWDTPNPELAQAWRSQFALELIRENVETVWEAFHGINDAGGIDDALISLEAQYLDRPLAEVMAESFQHVFADLDALQMPLSDAVLNDAVAVGALYDDFRSLLVLMRADLVSALSIVLTVSDNDGD